MKKNQQPNDQHTKKKLLEIRQGQEGTEPQSPFDYTGPDSYEAEADDPLPPYIDEKGNIKNAKRSTYGQGVPPFQEPVFEIHMHRIKNRNQKNKKQTKNKGSG